MSIEKVYLGDAVYVDRDEYGRLVLTTEDGYRATNTIVLEPDVFRALKTFGDRLLEPTEQGGE